MRDTGMICHPDSKPISRTAGDTALMDPPADPELHPGAQASLDFIASLGLGDEVPEKPQSHDDKDKENTPESDLHPGAQASMDFLNSLGLDNQGTHLPQNHANEEEYPQTPNGEVNPEEEQDNDSGNEL